MFGTLNSIWRITLITLKNLIRNTKMIILGIFIIFINIQIIEPLKECAVLMDLDIALLEPFVAICNSNMVVAILPLVYLVIMADYPFEGDINIFLHIRCSKKKWILGQMLFAFLTAFLFVLFTMIVSMILLIPEGYNDDNFSYAVTRFIQIYPEKSGSYIAQLITEKLYNQMDLIHVAVISFILLLLYLFLLALIVLFFSLLNKKMMGIILACLFVFLGAITETLNLKVMWLFPMSHSIVEIHFSEYFNIPVFPLFNSFVYFGILLLVMIISCLFVGKNYEIIK